jgi:hypothetical protein
MQFFGSQSGTLGGSCVDIVFVSYARDLKHYLSLIYENIFYGHPPAVQLRSPLEEEE